MPKTLIRRATRADLPILLEIDKASFPPGVAYDSAELAYFMNRIGSETIVLEHNGKIAAFLIMEVNSRRQAATMITLDVLVDFRRQGYASRLVRHSEDMLAGLGVNLYELQVDVENGAAIAFYVKHGFYSTGKLRKYYPNGHDAHVMIKKLPASAAT
jgi:ribosomal protein S18 acetylase RimI-like enzyme